MALLSTQYRTVVSIYVNLFLLLVGIGSKTNFVVLPNPAWRHILPADLRFITSVFFHIQMEAESTPVLTVSQLITVRVYIQRVVTSSAFF